jgi:hypothetical protein
LRETLAARRQNERLRPLAMEHPGAALQRFMLLLRQVDLFTRRL